jgi:hopanoid biosynthesis associated RND transporter like protein HpnN
MDLVRRRARGIVAGTLVLTLLLGAYTALNLGVNSDTVSLVGRDLPSRRNHDAFAAIFPNLENALLVVVDGATPELAREAAETLAERLRQEEDRFTDVYLPGGGSFFERNGLLYLSVEDLDVFADHMASLQPILGTLERDRSIDGLAGLVREALEESRELERVEQWAEILDRVGEATVAVYSEFPLEISWEELLMRDTSLHVVKRRVIVAHPILDFDSILAAAPALSRIHAVSEELGYTRESGVSVRVTGNPALNVEEMIGLAWDIGMAGLFCFLLVSLVLYRALRSLRLLVAAIATLLVGLVWTAAWATASVGHLNVISMSFAILFIGLGVDFSVHLGMRYADLLRAGEGHGAALRGAAESIGSSLVICAVTTSIGFFAFVPTTYLGVAELGMIAGGGMAIILLLTSSFLPALLSTWLRLDPERHVLAQLSFRRIWWSGILGRPAWVCGAAAAAFLASLPLLPRSYFDTNVIAMRDPSMESVQAFDDLLSQAGTASPWYVNSVTEDLDAAREQAARMDELDVVSEAVHLGDYVPADQEEKLEILADLALLLETPSTGDRSAKETPAVDEQVAALRELHEFLTLPPTRDDQGLLAESARRLRERIGVLLDRIDREGNAADVLDELEHMLLARFPDQIARLRRALEAEPITLDDLPSELRARMIAVDGRARVQIFPAESLKEYGDFMDFAREVRRIDPRATGIAINIIEFGQAAQDAFFTALGWAVLVIAAFLWILWRRVTFVALAMAPLFVSSALTIAVLVLLGTGFNYTNVIVIPLLFGIGIDSGIHLVHRAMVEGARGPDLLETTTARAVFYSAVTTTVSFGSLAFSSHPGMQSFGALLSVGMVFTVVCNLVVLPALLELTSRSKRLTRVAQG